MAKFLYDVFQSLHREVVPGTDKEVCGEALAALKELVHMLSTAPSDEDQVEFLRGTLENIIGGKLWKTLVSNDEIFLLFQLRLLK